LRTVISEDLIGSHSGRPSTPRRDRRASKEEEGISMTGTRKITASLIAATLLLGAAPVAAQDEATPSAGIAEVSGPIEVSGVDYAFVGLPTSVPAGTQLTFRNDGTEIHEMAVIHILDETTPLEELMAMPE
jgi:hypothetical protein